jgi:hypothetical protein
MKSFVELVAPSIDPATFRDRTDDRSTLMSDCYGSLTTEPFSLDRCVIVDIL